MEIFFLGVGEACDPENFNTSILIKRVGEDNSSILLDCGFTAPHHYWAHTSDPEELSAIWVSHFHGDHFMGIPLLILRFFEMGRRAPLFIVGPAGIEDTIIATVNLAYPDFLEKLSFQLNFIELQTEKTISLCGLQWQCAVTEHSQNAHALRLDHGTTSLFYSGDGRPTKESQKIAKGCKLIIHEAFSFHKKVPGHGTVHHAINFARQARASLLALVHIEHTERKHHYQDILSLIKEEKDLQILLPSPGYFLHLE